MRILSWNLNGIKSCMRRGDFDQIRALPLMDVICFQEIRTQERMKVLDRYHHIWYPAEQKKYSGTLTLSLVMPVDVKLGFGIPELDKEGRIITIDHGSVFIVNVYVPNSQGGPEREDYRREWDEYFRLFLSDLSEQKPVIVCGDFNVTMSRLDIYAENTRMVFKENGFASDERSNLLSIMEDGFVDAYRYLYPAETGAWTWWSNRRNRREADRGWRLDYFLVSDSIKGTIIDVEHHNEITGSDHCPIVLDCTLQDDDYEEKYTRAVEEKRATEEQNSKYAEMWAKHSARFKEYEEKLAEIQKNITVCDQLHLRDDVHRYQLQILDDIRFRCLAVNKIAQGLQTPVGVDNIKWRTDDEKMRAAMSLNWRGYEASPKKIIDIKSRNTGKIRPTGILTYRDRAMSTLAGYTFAPIEEARADRESFGFRKGRSTQDAVIAAANLFIGPDAPDMFVYLDIRGFYAAIQHKWILKHVPIEKDILEAFLKAGHIVSGELFPSSDVGISEGSPLSPMVANFTLDGLQKVIYRAIHGTTAYIDYMDGAMVRYADDIVVAVRTPTGAQSVIDAVKDFLTPRGLVISEEKSSVGYIQEGFHFIGFTVRRDALNISIRPREESVDRFISGLHEFITTFNKSQRDLIEALNKKLKGWAGHYRFCDAYDSYRKIDAAVKASLLEAMMRKHPNAPYQQVISRYWWIDEQNRNWFCLPENNSIRVIHLVDTLLIALKRARTDVNPYFETDYIVEKKKASEIDHVGARYRPIYERQGGKCFYCKRPLLIDQQKRIVPISHKKKMTIGNSAYIHAECEQHEYQFLMTMEDVDGISDYSVYEMLTRISKSGTIIRDSDLPDNWKYLKLYEYFGLQSASKITLTFSEIESILGFPLTESIKTSRPAWYSRKDGHMMADAWNLQGYKLAHLYPGKKKAVFESVYEDAEKVVIPAEILDRKVPVRAKREIEHFLAAIVKKYGLSTEDYFPSKSGDSP